MPEKPPPAPKLTIKPVTKATWKDFETLFESKGAPSYCWCMPFREIDADRASSTKADRKRGMKAFVDKRKPVGLLGYVKGEPVAWCSVGPRDSFLKTLTEDYDPEEGAPGVWSVTCFFVRRDFRGEGFTAKMLEAAVKQARKRGAKVVEGYGVDPKSPSYRHMGFVGLFKGAGFKKAGKIGSRRHVMRLEK